MVYYSVIMSENEILSGINARFSLYYYFYYGR